MKLYLVTRADLTVGQQAVQAAHAAVEYARLFRKFAMLEHPTIVMVVVRDEEYLRELAVDVFARTDQIAEFHEPDLGGALTAFATSGEQAARVLRGLPLTGAT